MIMTHQCQFVSCEKCTTPVQDADGGGYYACTGWGTGDMWELSVLSAQFCCEPKTAIKEKKKKPHLSLFLKSQGRECSRRNLYVWSTVACATAGTRIETCPLVSDGVTWARAVSAE